MTKGIDSGLLAHVTRKAREASVRAAVAAFAELRAPTSPQQGSNR